MSEAWDIFPEGLDIGISHLPQLTAAEAKFPGVGSAT